MNDLADLDINSSDFDFEAPTVDKRATFRGQASVTELLKPADSNRRTSKRTVTQLQFGYGAPGTESNQTPLDEGDS